MDSLSLFPASGVSVPNSVRLEILSANECRRQAVVQLGPNQAKHVRLALYDPKFGSGGHTQMCETCRQKRSCVGHFGNIVFEKKVINPLFLQHCVQLLKKICPYCSHFRNHILPDCEDDEPPDKDDKVTAVVNAEDDDDDKHSAVADDVLEPLPVTMDDSAMLLFDEEGLEADVDEDDKDSQKQNDFDDEQAMESNSLVKDEDTPFWCVLQKDLTKQSPTKICTAWWHSVPKHRKNIFNWFYDSCSPWLLST